MMTRAGRAPWVIVSAGLGAALMALSSATLAGDRAATLQAKCWTPEALSGPAEAKQIHRGDHRFDAPAPEATLVPAAPIEAPLRGAIRRVHVAGGRKLVALTFDLCELRGEITGYDAALIDYLRAQRIKATFFTGGKWMRSHAERIHQLMSDPLFEIANHGEAHRNLRLLEGAALREEILGPQRSYELARSALSSARCVQGEDEVLASIPPRLSLFRFPFGACHAASLDAVNDAGLLAIQWDVSTGDPVPAQSAEAIAAILLKRIKPGSIVIGHANGRGFNTAAAMPLALPELKARGFEFVTVSELLAAGTPEISPTCYDNRPGDTDRYDTFFSKKASAPASAPPATSPPTPDVRHPPAH